MAYGDLFVNFTPHATDGNPIISKITLVITQIYKQVYGVVYGPGTYSSDDSTDEHSIITSDEFFSEILAICSEIIQLWHDASPPTPVNAGESMPTFRLSLVDQVRLKDMALHLLIKADPIHNVKLWNEAVDDIRVR